MKKYQCLICGSRSEQVFCSNTCISINYLCKSIERLGLEINSIKRESDKILQVQLQKKMLNRCEKCKEFLDPKKEVWLELDTRKNTFTNRPVPKKHSQGCFPFGTACAKRVLKNGGKI